MFGFGIVAENFEVFQNNIFDCKVLWIVLLVCSFCAVCSAVSRSVDHFTSRILFNSDVINRLIRLSGVTAK